MDKLAKDVIDAAENWYRIILRSDKELAPYEEFLFEAIVNYRNNVSNNKLPPPPKIPKFESNEYDIDTSRYSDIPTQRPVNKKLLKGK